MGEEGPRQGRGGGEVDGMVLGDGVGVVVVGLPEPVCFGSLQNGFRGHGGWVGRMSWTRSASCYEDGDIVEHVEGIVELAVRRDKRVK
jgi:hypothetical protein